MRFNAAANTVAK